MTDATTPESTQDILEKLSSRCEMIRRVRQDLDRVNELQRAFAESDQGQAHGDEPSSESYVDALLRLRKSLIDFQSAPTVDYLRWRGDGV